MPTPYWESFIDMQNLAKGEEELQHARASNPARLQLINAQARMQTQAADEKEEEAAVMRSATDLVKVANGSGEQVDPVQGLRIQADFLSKMGRPMKAVELLNKIELAESRDQRQKLQAVQMKKLEQHLAFQQAQHIEQALGNVTNQQELDDAIAIFEDVFQEPVPDSYRTYSPQMVETVRRNAMSVKDRIATGLREAELQRRKDKDAASVLDRDNKNSIARQRVDIAARSVEIRENREQRLAKEGSGPKSKNGGIVPPKAMVDHAFSVIHDAYPDMPKDQVRFFARDAAADAQSAIRANPGIDMKTAIYDAVTKNTGNIETQMKGGIFGIGGKETPAYRGIGASEKNPMPMPDTVDKLVPGRFYRDANGVVKQWKPKGK